MKLWSIVEKHNGSAYVMNGAPMTRSWFDRAAARPEAATLNSAENSVAWRTHHTLLYTPILMNRYGGNSVDSDPLYNHTEAFPHDALRRRAFMTAPCLSITDHLDFGALSIGYDGMFNKSDVPTIYETMTPTTPVEIDEGLIIGKERTITKRSGVYTAPRGYKRSTVYWYEDCLLSKATNGSHTVAVELQPREIAVIVWA